MGKPALSCLEVNFSHVSQAQSRLNHFLVSILCMSVILLVQFLVALCCK